MKKILVLLFIFTTVLFLAPREAKAYEFLNTSQEYYANISITGSSNSFMGTDWYMFEVEHTRNHPTARYILSSDFSIHALFTPTDYNNTSVFTFPNTTLVNGKNWLFFLGQLDSFAIHYYYPDVDINDARDDLQEKLDYSFFWYSLNYSSQEHVINEFLTRYKNHHTAIGYGFGYDDGYDEGEVDGYNTGYLAGLTVGLDAGYTTGFNAGETVGYANGLIAGELIGFGLGQTALYNLGSVANGFNQFNSFDYINGFSAGEIKGRGDIFSDGFEYWGYVLEDSYDFIEFAGLTGFDSGYLLGQDNMYQYGSKANGYNEELSYDFVKALQEADNIATRNFMNGFEKWIVPVVIITFFVGGFLSIKLRKRV